VAGPIGEALIATAVGIAVAVPAVVGYNLFLRRNKVILALLDDVATDVVHLALKTSFIIGSAKPKPDNPVETGPFDPPARAIREHRGNNFQAQEARA
jgi:biopolymer transport protein ExbB